MREWLGLDEDAFYDSRRVAITPMGFCFPGLDQKGGDLPPRRECSQTWQQRVSEAMPQVKLVLVIGMYAQRAYLGARCARTLTDTVKDWEAIYQSQTHPRMIPLPHPSWRNNSWIKKNPFFSNDLLPFLKAEIQTHMAGIGQ